MKNSRASVLAFGKKTPDIHSSVFIADGARIVGEVEIGEGSSVWFNAVVRGDVAWIRIGRGVNIQDNATLHVTHDTAPLRIDDDVTVGHGAVVHGCTIESGCLIGMRAVVLDGAVVGRQSLVAAGSAVREGTVVPAGVLVAGNPAVVKRKLSADEKADIKAASERYTEYAHMHEQTYRER